MQNTPGSLSALTSNAVISAWQRDELAKRHKQTNSAETVKVFWSYCQNEHTKIPIRGTVWACVRKKKPGQTKEKIAKALRK